MAFDSSKLAKLAHSNDGPSLWSYSTTDTAATVDTAGYFTGDAVNMLRAGDFMLINANGVGGINRVASNDGTTVDLADATALTATDTD